MMDTWDEARLQRMIDAQEPEGLSLEYKRAATTDKNNNSKDAITKAVSAMANSAGGTVIFGIANFRDTHKKHLPEKLDPIDINEFSEEWLGQKIGLIQPRIDGVKIVPVPLNSGTNHVAYVIEIPQSTTAHQATDYVYYKRFDSRSVPMADYEIRDVMGRVQHPKIVLEFSATLITEEKINNLLPNRHNRIKINQRNFNEVTEKKPIILKNNTLYIRARNVGTVYAQYMNAFIQIPKIILPNAEARKAIRAPFQIEDTLYLEFSAENISNNGIDTREQSRHIHQFPILPSTSRGIMNIKLVEEFEDLIQQEMKIIWMAQADNSPRNSGEIFLKDIKIDTVKPSAQKQG